MARIEASFPFRSQRREVAGEFAGGACARLPWNQRHRRRFVAASLRNNHEENFRKHRRRPCIALTLPQCRRYADKPLRVFTISIEKPLLSSLPSLAVRAPRRVALVTDWCLPRKGGIETNVMALAKSLIARGIDARILTSFPGPCEIDGVAIDRDAGLRLPLFELAASPRLVSRLAACLGAGGYDMVHVHASIVAPFCFAAVPAAYRVGLPVLVTFHSVMRNLPAMLAMSDRMMGWSGWNVTLTGVSSLVAGQIREAFPRRGVGILPNGLDVGFWRSGEGSAPQPGPLRLATAMRLRARKRPFALVDIFADALARARAAGTDMTLTIAGDGPKRAALWRHIERKGLAGTIRIAGWQDPPALRALYAESDAFVMPSTKEAFCIAALEARSAGLPVIARAGTGIADFIEDGVSGLLAHSDSAMAETLAAVARDRIRLRKLAIMPRNLARYGWDTLADEHIRTYADCMARAELVI